VVGCKDIIICNWNQAFSFKYPLILGALGAYSFIVSFGALTAGRPRLRASRGVHLLCSYVAMPNGTANLQGAQPKD
jgi:hypothetical protein